MIFQVKFLMSLLSMEKKKFLLTPWYLWQGVTRSMMKSLQPMEQSIWKFGHIWESMLWNHSCLTYIVGLLKLNWSLMKTMKVQNIFVRTIQTWKIGNCTWRTTLVRLSSKFLLFDYGNEMVLITCFDDNKNNKNKFIL